MIPSAVGSEDRKERREEEIIYDCLPLNLPDSNLSFHVSSISFILSIFSLCLLICFVTITNSFASEYLWITIVLSCDAKKDWAMSVFPSFCLHYLYHPSLPYLVHLWFAVIYLCLYRLISLYFHWPPPFFSKNLSCFISSSFYLFICVYIWYIQ